MDNAQEKHMYRFGLLGKDIDYSFSRNYFANKFKANQLPCTYENFDIKSISEFPHLIQNNPELSGLNVIWMQSIIKQKK